jgi:LCP family protein required for cell wall assembly
VAGVSSPAPDAPAPRRKGKTQRRRTVGRVLLVSSLLLALGTALGVVFIYRHLNGNLTTIDGLEEIDNRPEDLYEGNGKPLNILVMGSDSREGANAIDSEDPANGARSDTTVILHISADRDSAYGISIPRDSVVDRPDCGDDNEISGQVGAKWNAAFAVGGPLCTVEQVEQTTGIRIDEFVVIDFNGFKEMVDAVGGVEICVPEEINDPERQIFVPAGTNELRGDQALDYVRARYEVGSQSDLGRIKRQQNFMASMINRVVSKGTLTRPDKVVRFLSAATKSLDVSEGLSSVAALGDLALQLRSTGLDEIRFVTVPWEYDDDYDVLWLPESKQLFESTSKDEPLSEELSSDAIDAGRPPGSESTSPGGTRSPSESSSEDAQQAADNGLCS